MESVFDMLRENRSNADWATDMDLLLNSEGEGNLYWTAPKWIAEGDVVFFYHTRRAKQRSKKLMNEVRSKYPRKRKLLRLLERAYFTAERFSGKIFACANVAGSVERFSKNKKHFVSPHFAPINDVFVFDSPLSQSAFAGCVKIGRSTITPLFKRELTGIKKLLSSGNELPEFLKRAAAGSAGFKDVNAKNWLSVACAPNAKFVHEAQMRAYWLDYLLKELKDKGIPLLEECECFRDSKNTGRADYFVKVHGRWLPVEAKLKITDEKAALRQIAKYTNVDSFVPKKGIYRERVFKVNETPISLLVDALGIYLISAKNEFICCSHKNPVWKRETMSKETIEEMREAIKNHLCI